MDRIEGKGRLQIRAGRFDQGDIHAHDTSEFDPDALIDRDRFRNHFDAVDAVLYIGLLKGRISGTEGFINLRLYILRFLDDFEIVSWVEKDSFDDAWRVFGRYAALPPEQLPRDTSLRRAFADRLASGGKTGCGCGIIVFDGEKIVR